MFNLKRLVQRRGSGHQAAPRQTEPGPAPVEPVRLVAITQSPEDSATLRQIAANYGWALSIVGSSGAAIAALNNQPTPLVICDGDLPGECWHDVLVKVASLPQAVCVLLASRVIDDYLWQQVIRDHGYDVVAKPFEPEELRRAVTFAWSWRGWARRHYTDAWRSPTA